MQHINVMEVTYMEKIVLLSNQTKSNSNLIKCLEKLFPECQIEVHSKEQGIQDNQTAIIDTPCDDVLEDKKLDKLMSFL